MLTHRQLTPAKPLSNSLDAAAAITSYGGLMLWEAGSDDAVTSIEPLECADLVGLAGAGDQILLALTKDGILYCWCPNPGGRRDAWAPEQNIPTVIFSHEVVHIATGAEHAIAILESGEVWSWGNGDGGRLGHGDELSLKEPRLVETLRGACVGKQAAAGFGSTLLLTQDEDVYCWGMVFGIPSPESNVPRMVHSLHHMRVAQAT